MSPVFLYIGGVAAAIGGWLADYDGTLNDDSEDIVIAADPPVRRDDNDRVDVWFGSDEAIAKVGNYLVFIDTNLNVTDFVDLETEMGLAATSEIHRVNIIKNGNFFALVTFDPDNGASRRVQSFRLLEFSHSPGFGITVINNSGLWSDGSSNPSTDVDVDELQVTIIDATGDGTVLVQFRGFSTGGQVIIDDYFSSSPDPRTQGTVSSFIDGRIILPSGSSVTLFPAGENGFLRLFPGVTANNAIVAVSGNEVGTSPNFQDRIIVFVAERINQVFGPSFPTVDGMRPIDDVAGWLDLTSQLLLGTADPDGIDGGTLIPEFRKIGINLFVAINRKAAVLFEMDEINGDGTVLDTLSFSATIFNSGAQMQNINVTRSQCAAFPSGSPVNTAEIVANFDKLDALGAIVFRYFNVVVRVDLLTNTFDVTVNGPIQTDQNVSSGPAFVDEWFGEVAPDEIWNLWGAQSGSDMLLRGMKIKR